MAAPHDCSGATHVNDDVRVVASLAEPVRGELYAFVAAHDGPVSRDEAAAALHIPRHTAKFHLDKLAGEGLLVASYGRRHGAGGPGAGRPAKLYERAQRDVSVSFPERRYQIAGAVMARAITRSVTQDVPIAEALQAVAGASGDGLAEQAARRHDTGPADDPLLATCGALADNGYEPRIDGDVITLANCPFHDLATTSTEVVCGMNLALLSSLVRVTGSGRLTARLEPAAGRCCVVVRRDDVGRGAAVSG